MNQGIDRDFPVTIPYSHLPRKQPFKAGGFPPFKWLFPGQMTVRNEVTEA